MTISLFKLVPGGQQVCRINLSSSETEVSQLVLSASTVCLSVT